MKQSNHSMRSDFEASITGPQPRYTKYLKALLQPRSALEYDKLSCAVSEGVRSMMETVTQQDQLQTLMKFITGLVLCGHLHVLATFTRSIMPALTRLFSRRPIAQTPHQTRLHQRRIQFARQLLFLLAQWFPNDFTDPCKESTFTRAVQSRNLNVKKMTVLTSAWLAAVERDVEGLAGEEGACEYCAGALDSMHNQQEGETGVKGDQNETKLGQMEIKGEQKAIPDGLVFMEIRDIMKPIDNQKSQTVENKNIEFDNKNAVNRSKSARKKQKLTIYSKICV